ncbi:MAG TPA: hypothetical protein VNG33_21515, partial [Polyangiaceae bacterium]|nr:hypothetical protein [Polyangiaceae bacterium]
GDGHTCGVRGAGLLFGWGRNTAANLGLGQTNDQQRRAATQIGTDQDWESVVSGQDSSCGIRLGGNLFCWGGNSFGNLGLGDTTQRLLPAAVGVGLLFGWGRNTAANLGLGQTTDQQRRSATQIGTDQDWQSVVSGQDSSCAIRLAGRLFCWGGNSFGNLGLGDTTQRLVPTEVVAGRVWTQIAIDTFHACGIDDAQNLYCWGRGIEGQLGTGALDAVLTPTLIGSGYAQVAVGRMSTCAVTTDARVLCTGENANGQLGLADNRRRNIFTEVLFP